MNRLYTRGTRAVDGCPVMVTPGSARDAWTECHLGKCGPWLLSIGWPVAKDRPVVVISYEIGRGPAQTLAAAIASLGYTNVRVKMRAIRRGSGNYGGNGAWRVE